MNINSIEFSFIVRYSDGRFKSPSGQNHILCSPDAQHPFDTNIKIIQCIKGELSMKKLKNIAAAALAAMLVQSTIFAGVTFVKAEAQEQIAIAEGHTAFTFSDEGITVAEGEETGYSIEGTTLTINKAGTYCLSGNCKDGSVKVTKQTTNVIIILDGLELNSELTAPFLFNSNTEVKLLVYGENVISDTEANNDKTHADNMDAENSVIKSKSGSVLSINGSGTLTVNANGKNAIKSNGSLVIENGTLNIDSVDGGISNEDTVAINGGYINIKSGGDGINSSADDSAKGSVTVNGGTIIIDSMKDGMQATEAITINDGSLNIKTYGGADAVYDKDDDAYPSAKGLKVSGSYDVIVNEETGETKEVDATECDLVINGGTIVLNCADDAIHADRDVTINRGNITIESGDDGIHADYINTIGTIGGNDNDLSIYVKNSVEAVEGAEIYLNSGVTKLFASDDGVNAANSDLKNYAFKLVINGGNHYVSCSEGDGFDSNGALTFNGGNTVALGSSGAGEGDPLDCDGQLTINGGNVLAIGTYSPMAALPNNTSHYVQFGAMRGMQQHPGGMGKPGFGEQIPGMGDPMQRPDDVSGAGAMPGMGNQMPGGMDQNISMSNISIKEGDVVTVCDASGEAICSATAQWLGNSSNYQATYVFCWSDKIDSEKTYQLMVNGTKAASTDEMTTQPNDRPDDNPNQQPETIYQMGDADKNGKVELADAKKTLRHALHLELLEDITYADIDKDGTITLSDAKKVLRVALHLETY